MNKQEAIDAMMRGNKLSHRLFQEHEWITIDRNSNAIITEGGHVIPPRDFWEYVPWEDGWFIWE